jgi:hypothetical protein
MGFLSQTLGATNNAVGVSLLPFRDFAFKIYAI